MRAFSPAAAALESPQKTNAVQSTTKSWCSSPFSNLVALSPDCNSLSFQLDFSPGASFNSPHIKFPQDHIHGSPQSSNVIHTHRDNFTSLFSPSIFSPFNKTLKTSKMDKTSSSSSSSSSMYSDFLDINEHEPQSCTSKLISEDTEADASHDGNFFHHNNLPAYQSVDMQNMNMNFGGCGPVGDHMQQSMRNRDGSSSSSSSGSSSSSLLPSSSTGLLSLDGDGDGDGDDEIFIGRGYGNINMNKRGICSQGVAGTSTPRAPLKGKKNSRINNSTGSSGGSSGSGNGSGGRKSKASTNSNAGSAPSSGKGVKRSHSASKTDPSSDSVSLSTADSIAAATATTNNNNNNSTNTNSASKAHNGLFASPAALVRGSSSQPSNISPAGTDSSGGHCNCKKSKCLKLYCECFAALRYCKNCNCVECHNNAGHEKERQDAVMVTKERNSHAFESKVNNKQGHTAGCNCKKSQCLKKYCECFEGAVFCGDNCKCLTCENYSGSAKLIDINRRHSNNEKKQEKLSTVAVTAAAGEVGGSVTIQTKEKEQQLSSPHTHLLTVNNVSLPQLSLSLANKGGVGTSEADIKAYYEAKAMHDAAQLIPLPLPPHGTLMKYDSLPSSSSSSSSLPSSSTSSSTESGQSTPLHSTHHHTPHQKRNRRCLSDSSDHSSSGSASGTEVEGHLRKVARGSAAGSGSFSPASLSTSSSITSPTSVSSSGMGSSGSGSGSKSDGDGISSGNELEMSPSDKQMLVDILDVSPDSSPELSYLHSSEKISHVHSSLGLGYGGHGGHAVVVRGGQLTMQLEPRYPFFGLDNHRSTKLTALRCLEFLNNTDLYSMSLVNKLWSQAAMDDALWE